jgi:hypothetical protein
VFLGAPALRRTILLVTFLLLIAAAVGTMVVGRGS